MSNVCKVENCDRPKDKSQGSSMCVMHRVRWSRHKSHDLPVKPGFPDGIVKKCKIHGMLSRDEAYLNGKNNHYQCRYCKKDALKRFESKNPNREQTRNYIHIGRGSKRIAVPKQTYEKMVLNQNNLCAICNKPERMTSANKRDIKKLAIDHCHTTNKIRGLLCHQCNVSLGGFKDSIELLQSAIAYLNEHA